MKMKKEKRRKKKVVVSGLAQKQREMTDFSFLFFHFSLFFIFSLVVFTVAMRRCKRSLQSFIMLVYSVSLIRFVSLSRSSQYSVSAHSLSEIVVLSRKSFLLMAYWASVRFAPIDVPERSICFAKTYSCFSSQRYLFRLYILIANF